MSNAIVKVTAPQVLNGTIASSGIQSGLPVKGEQWRTMAELSNFIMGHGGTLVSANGVYDQLTAGLSTVYRYYIWPRYACITRMWVLVLRSVGEQASGTFSVDGNQLGLWAIGKTEVPYFVYYEPVTRSNVPTDVYVTITSDSSSGTYTYVAEIACYEVPRRYLNTDANEAGALQDSNRAGDLIYDGDNAKSVGGVVGAIPGGISICRRNAHFHWYDPDSIEFSTSYTNVFLLDPEILGRKLLSGDSGGATAGRTMSCCVYAEVSGGGAVASAVRITTTSGNVQTIDLDTGAAPEWSEIVTFDVDCEDPDTSDGRRGATWEEVAWAVQKAENNVDLYGISVGEAEP